MRIQSSMAVPSVTPVSLSTKAESTGLIEPITITSSSSPLPLTSTATATPTVIIASSPSATPTKASLQREAVEKASSNEEKRVEKDAVIITGEDETEEIDVGAAGTGAVVDMEVFGQLLEIVRSLPLPISPPRPSVTFFILIPFSYFWSEKRVLSMMRKAGQV